MGAGKSTVGRRLAERLGLPFVDTDDLLSERFGPIPAQFADEGEAVFRAREAEIVTEIVAGPPVVAATGGGLWVDPKNRARLREAFDLVVLDAPLDVLATRVGAGAGRPLWGDDVAARYAARRPAYADADLRIDVSHKDPDTIVEEIVAWRNARR